MSLIVQIKKITRFELGPVSLVGGASQSEGNVIAVNPTTGISGPVCDDNWDINDVSICLKSVL